MGKRLIQQRRGRAHGRYHAPAHRFMGKIKYLPSNKTFQGVVEDLLHDPGRTAPLAKVRLPDKSVVLMLAPEGIKLGDPINCSRDKQEPTLGAILPIGQIPEGIAVNNVELKQGDGGKLARAAGGYATVVSHEEGKTVLQLPSGSFKSIDSNCRATIGVLAGGGRKDKPFLKAGKKYHAWRTRGKQYPVVRGVAMNAVAHPHGGGAHQHVGKPSTVKRGASPGRKVGSIAAKRTGRK